MVISLGVDWELKMGAGLDFTTLLAIVPFRLSASIGGSGKSGIKSLSACNKGHRSCMTFLTLGTTSLGLGLGLGLIYAAAESFNKIANVCANSIT